MELIHQLNFNNPFFLAITLINPFRLKITVDDVSGR